MKPILNYITTRWAAMTPTMRTFAIGLPVATLIMEWPQVLGFLPKDLQTEAGQLAYWCWKGALAFVSWHVIGGKGLIVPPKPLPDPAQFSQPQQPTPPQSK